MADTRQLQAFKKRMDVTIENFPLFLDRTIDKLSDKFLADVVQRTPINKDVSAPTRGQLKRNWQKGVIKGSGLLRSVRIYNNTEYAQYVELGHRKANGTGWVEGQFFLENTINQFEKEKDAIVDKELSKYLNSTLYRGRRQPK